MARMARRATGRHRHPRDRPSTREARARALGALAADGVALPARGPAGRPARAAAPARGSRASPRRSPRTSRRSRPETEVRSTVIEHRATRGTSRRSTARSTTSRARYPFEPEREDYLVHITTGTHVAQICLFLLTESRHLPGAPPPDVAAADAARGTRPGSYTIIDLDLSRVRPHRRALSAGAARRASRSSRPASTRENAAFNRLIERIEQVAIALARSAAAHRADRRGQVAARAAHLRAEEGAAAGRAASSSRSTAPRCAATRRCRRSSATCRARSRARPRHAAGTAAQGRRGRALPRRDRRARRSTSRPCCCARIEDKTLLPGRLRPGGAERLPADRRHQPRSRRPRSRAGRFREDLLARINLWTFRLPGLRERPEDIEPNLDYELERVGDALKQRLTMSREARERFLASRRSPEARWRGNFRDFSAALRRMATLATAAASASPRSTTRSSACAPTGAASARRRGRHTSPTASSTACSTTRASPRSIASTGSSSRRSSASAGPRAHCRRPAASCSPRRAPRAPRRTTPIASASTSPGTASRCRRSSRPDRAPSADGPALALVAGVRLIPSSREAEPRLPSTRNSLGDSLPLFPERGFHAA